MVSQLITFVKLLQRLTFSTNWMLCHCNSANGLNAMKDKSADVLYYITKLIRESANDVKHKLWKGKDIPVSHDLMYCSQRALAKQQCKVKNNFNLYPLITHLNKRTKFKHKYQKMQLTWPTSVIQID